MNYRYFTILVLILVFISSISFSQNISKEVIKNSSLYYSGEAIAEDYQQAIDKALGKLVEEIAVRVQSTFTMVKTENNEEVSEKVEDILKTYASATLTNVEKNVIESEGQYHAFVYIEKKKVYEIFESRKRLVRDLYLEALESESEKKYGYALKMYYFAIILINSIPEQNIIWNNINLTTEIPDKMNDIIHNINFELVKDRSISEQERELHFVITHGNELISHLEFSFWDGANEIHVAAKDGKGIFRLIGSSAKFERLDLRIKYSYYECREEIKEVSELWDLVERPNFKNRKKVDLIIEKDMPPLITEIQDNASISKNEKVYSNLKLILNNTDDCPVIDNISQQTLEFLVMLDNNDLALINKAFSKDPYLRDKILNVIKYNSLKLTDETIEADVHKTYDGWEIRAIPVLNSYSSINKQSAESLIFDFTEEGNLNDLSYGIMEELYNKFVKQGELGEDWWHRQIIIKFVEKYRTAFLTRDLETLHSIFADEAVIIVGRILKNKEGYNKFSDAYSQLSLEQPDVEYLRYSKDEYIKRQEQIFNRYKDIYLGYSTFNITKKSRKDSVYGISMRQNYHSTNYADEGYLFLLVDFTEAVPLIYVRSWQPQEWNQQALIQLSNFHFNR